VEPKKKKLKYKYSFYRELVKRTISYFYLRHTTPISASNAFRCHVTSAHTNSFCQNLLELRCCTSCYQSPDQCQRVVIEKSLQIITTFYLKCFHGDKSSCKMYAIELRGVCYLKCLIVIASNLHTENDNYCHSEYVFL